MLIFFLLKKSSPTTDNLDNDSYEVPTHDMLIKYFCLCLHQVDDEKN